MDRTVQIINEKAMQSLAQEMANKVQAGDTLLLKGDLGAGKTTFTKYLAAYLGVEDVVSSPTFTVIAEYEVKGNSNIKEFVHVDLYRFEGVDKEMSLSLKELWSEAKENGRVIVIEWPERLGEKVPLIAWQLEFLPGKSALERVVKIKGK